MELFCTMHQCMKYTFTILFACLLVGAKAQNQAVADTLVELPTVVIKNDMVRQYINYEVSNISVTNKTWGCGGNIATPNNLHLATPVDMMVRHYFAMSYWD
ncbi:MAG: hypothetical protein M0D57_21390 [Sphingobacteriales bacterium JAD_PAG50586_3]|nr:MAG: hypothetical protein M0D57_21390 [Sphingobacteriales bacterium JAD_PAG50586_3]